MSVNLEQHGWKGCVVPLSLENIEAHLPTWRHLQVLRPPETYGNRILRLPYDALYSTILPAYQMGEQIDAGTYGRIVKTQRALYTTEDPAHPTKLHRIEGFSEIVCKINEIDLSPEEDEEEYEEEVQAILHEASLHALAYHILASRGYPDTIPRLYEVYANSLHRTIRKASEIQSISIGMEYISGETLHSYFAEHFKPVIKMREIMSNDRLLMDILIQLCIYLDILQTELRFNHRDLKINNVLRRKHAGLWSRALEHPVLSRPWIAMHDLVIIDFGFSCVACEDSAKSLVQAGSWFRPSHDCLKGGRDIALFLHCLQAYYPLKSRISEKLWDALYAATTTVGQQTLHLLDCTIEKDGTVVPGSVEFGDGIYKVLRREDVDVPGCAPTALLKTLNDMRQF
jgi:serine/threonine protein kinase